MYIRSNQLYFKQKFVDENYYECTPIPLWQKSQPIINYDMFLERTDDEIIQIVRTKFINFISIFTHFCFHTNFKL